MTAEERVCEILARCRESSERGESIDTGAIVRAHPELALELEARFDALRVLDRAYPPRQVDSESASSSEDLAGKRIGPYRLLEPIGAGGMGTVWRAVVEGDAGGLEPSRTVALKLLHPHLFRAPGFFKRFLREAQVGRAVVHDNVVRTLDADAVWSDGRNHHFLVMEYVRGQTLRGLIREIQKVPEELCRHIGREVAKGLAAIHAAGIVHRDIKPENVLITQDHVVKVMDLGVARLADEAVRLSQTGAFVGSIQYAAPEQFARGGADVDARADLHALGLVLYELSSGVNPYLAEDLPRIVAKVLHEEPRRLGEVDPQLSPFFEEVVHCLLAKKREERFADANTLFDVLEEGETSAWWTGRAKAIRAVTHRPLRRIRIPRETAVYGRGAELAKLRALFDKAKSGEGQVVLVEGEAGIGKSRLVDEFVGQLQRDGEALNFLFGSYPPGGAATASGAFSTAYREQFGEAGAARWLPQTPVLVPAFDALLRGETTPSGNEPLTKDSIHTCFVHATRNLAASLPTIVLIDDLHFAPEEGRALFAALAMAVPGHRILLLGTTRPGIDEKWLSSIERVGASRLPLQRLGPKDLVRLLGDAFHSDRLAEELGAKIALKSDGNPFFVFEILRGLREGQFLTQKADGSWVTTRVIDEIRIPSSVLDLVNARVADLAEEDRDLLDIAACWGFEFDPLLVGEVLGIARIPLLKRLAQIERQHRLVRSAGLRFVFDHHQVQEALYGSLSELLRREYHAALAAALEIRTQAAEKNPETLDGAHCVALCEHFLKGAKGERALRYLAAAQAHLEKGYLTAQAVALAERALAVPGLLTGAERAKTLLRLCELNGPLDLLGRREQQEEAAREAERSAAHAADEELRGEALRALGIVFWRTSRPAEAEKALRRALEIARARGDKKPETAATGSLGCVFWSQGRLAEAEQQFERQLALSRETLDRGGEAGATGDLGSILWFQGRLTEARERYERCLAMSREIGSREVEAAAMGNLGNVFLAQGRLAEAKEHHERTLALSREIGYRLSEALDLVNLGGANLVLGDRVRARQALEPSLALCREIGDRYPEGYALVGLGSLADEEGDTSAAARLLDESLALRRQIGQADGVADSLLEIADLRRRGGDPAGARTALDEALSLLLEQKRAPQVVLAQAMLACLPGGEPSAALIALAQAGETGDTPRVRLLLWQASGDRTHLAAARRLLDEALSKVPAEHHEAMLTNVRVNREIAAAAKEAGIGA